jgi:hypothetical protein
LPPVLNPHCLFFFAVLHNCLQKLLFSEVYIDSGLRTRSGSFDGYIYFLTI